MQHLKLHETQLPRDPLAILGFFFVIYIQFWVLDWDSWGMFPLDQWGAKRVYGQFCTPGGLIRVSWAQRLSNRRKQVQQLLGLRKVHLVPSTALSPAPIPWVQFHFPKGFAPTSTSIMCSPTSSNSSIGPLSQLNRPTLVFAMWTQLTPQSF